MAKFLSLAEISGISDEQVEVKAATLKDGGKSIGKFLYRPATVERIQEFTATVKDSDDDDGAYETAVLLSECLVDEEGCRVTTPDAIMKWSADRVKAIISAISGKKV